MILKCGFWRPFIILEAENVLDVCPFNLCSSFRLYTCFDLAQVNCHFSLICQSRCSQIEAMLGGSAWDTMSMELNTDDPWEAETNMYFDMYTRMLADERPERRMSHVSGQ